MAHFAEINEQNMVLRIIVVNNDVIRDSQGNEIEEIGISFCKNLFGGTWIQTSYNAKIRGKYAAIGDTYNLREDLFISPQPYPSWIRTGSYWQAPVPLPEDEKMYKWNEEELRWDQI